MERREFLKTSTFAAVGLGIAPLETSCSQGRKTDTVNYSEGGSAVEMGENVSKSFVICMNNNYYTKVLCLKFHN